MIERNTNETKIADEAATIGNDGTTAKTFPAGGQDVATLTRGVLVVKIAKFFSTGVLIIFDDPTSGDGTKLMGWISPDALAPPSSTPPVATFIAPKVALDAGARPVATLDAGKADASIAVIDAGAPQSAGLLLQVRPDASNSCPVGMRLQGAFCRRPCISDAQCPKGTFCTSANGPKSCASTK